MRSRRNLTTAEGVYDCALDMLALREHGGQDMFRKLVEKGADPGLAEETVDRLKQAGLIDELRYADAVYRGWLDKRFYGRQHLVMYLVKNGVEQVCQQEILSRFSDELEAQRAGAAAEMFCRKYAYKRFADRRRLWSCAAAFMANRGFGASYADVILGRFTQDFADEL